MEKIAYFDTSHEMPEEIVSAAGFTPYKILGDIHKSTDSADQYLPKFFCPAARSWLTEGLANSKEWAGIIFVQGCNTTNNHYDVWKMHVDTPFLYWFNNPMKEDDTAKKFYKIQLKRMINDLEIQFNIKITDEKIFSAIRESNEIKILLQKIAELRSTKDISNRDYLELLINCFKMTKKEILQELKNKLEDFKLRSDFPSDKKRFLLTGTDVTYLELMDTLEECNIRVVRDDLSIGERYFATLIPEKDDPLDALIEYYLNIPKPATKPGIQKRIDYLLKMLRETEIDGVLSQNLKFCEPYAYDSVIVNNTIKEKGYKLIHLEREFTPVTDQQLVNRIMAFTEMI